MVKSFFEFIDLFNVPISFRYKKDDSYSTFVGGIFSFIFLGLLIGFGIDYCLPFFRRENYSLYYYNINLNQTEEIQLKEFKASLAFGFECSNIANKSRYTNISIEDLLELKAKYIFYRNVTNTTKKTDIPIGIHQCNNTDFYDDKNLIKSLSKGKISDLKCLDDLNQPIKNRYQDRHHNFTYYQIDVQSKNDSYYTLLRDFLLDNDCKIELYYIDAKVDVDDYEEPIKPFLTEVFLQLDPDLDLRMNNYFMNEYFESNNELFFPGKSGPKQNNLFSRMEQYFLHKVDAKKNSFAKIYIRADTRKMIVRRKYQTVLEFIADAFSFWDYLFVICQIVLNAYNRTSLNFFIENELLYFKGKENKHFNVSKNSQRIEKLLKLTNPTRTTYPKNIKGSSLFRRYINKKQNSKNTIINSIKADEIIINDIITYKNNSYENFGSDNNFIIFNDKNNFSKDDINDDITDCKDKNNIIIRSNNDDNLKEWSFIWKEIVFAFTKLINWFKCKCCNCKKDKEEKIRKRGESIIDTKLNIICYVKNMLLLDVINNMLNENKRAIYKFLSMPIISSNPYVKDKIHKQKGNEQHYSDRDFYELYKQIKNLNKKPLSMDDKKLIELTYDQLKKFKDIYY